jgi:hypothetical protein
MEMELPVADRSTDQSVTLLDGGIGDVRRPAVRLCRQQNDAQQMPYECVINLVVRCGEIKNVSRGREGRIGVFPGVVLRLILGGLAGQNEVVLHPRNRGSFSSKTRRENGVGQNGC